ncbi:DUF2510 domain-containing protein [Actinomadura craniellae]|uniref:DUF2510 domain-containing protein n=1 Tax=Actinomadura craniellae TaxID=2231787 RepID=UPI0018F13301|nr:DUF2510 domain-containing protein [Actinomadura craniellae]
MTGQTPPGWYPDPYGTPGLQRYWDGGQWTQATQPIDEWDDSSGAPARQPSPGGQQPPPAPQPNWSPSGPSTPPPWQAPGGPHTPPPWQPGPQTPQPWQPSPAGKSNTGLLWGLAGGGVVFLALIVVVALLATGVIGGSPEPTSSPAAASPTPPNDPGGRSPVVGTVTDEQAGLSYAQLGGKWQPASPIGSTDPLGRLGLTRGQTAAVQEDYDGREGDYVASVYSGQVATTVTPDDSLQVGARSFLAALPSFAYPAGYTQREIESRAFQVDGHSAWYHRLELSFPQAKSRNWNFTKEIVLFLTIERGEGRRPAVLYLSIPDSHVNQGDLDLLVNSVKVL